MLFSYGLAKPMKRLYCVFTSLFIICIAECSGQDADPFSFVKAPGKIYTKWDNPKVGYKIESQIKAYGHVSTTQYAIVGEDKEHWHVEYKGPEITALAANFPILKGQIMALKVKKSDRAVVEARMGLAGETLRKISSNPIAEMPKSPKLKKEKKKVKITIGGKEYEADYLKTQGFETWTASDGEFAGLLLQLKSPALSYELSGEPTTEKVKVGDTEFKALRIKYTNGAEYCLAKSAVLVSMGRGGAIKGYGVLSTKVKETSINIVKIETKAKAELNWDWAKAH